MRVIKELRLVRNLMIYTVPQLADCHSLIPTGRSHIHRRKKPNKLVMNVAALSFSHFVHALKNVTYIFVEGLFKGLSFRIV